MNYINLKIPEHSYFFGFVQTDGHLKKETSRNRGRLAVEINKEDRDILESFKKLFPSVYSSTRTRTRNTNFKKGYKSSTLTIYDRGLREEINKLGVPYGKKFQIISPPKTDFCERDYIRGLIDGDGSVGITATKLPFVSFTAKSEALKDYLLNVIEKVTGEKKELNRNRRDGIYNIMVSRERAQKFIEHIYYPGCLALKRKVERARVALGWRRPPNMRRILNKKKWEKWEDVHVLTHTVRKSCTSLNRTKSSVEMRLWRLKTKASQLTRP